MLWCIRWRTGGRQLIPIRCAAALTRCARTHYAAPRPAVCRRSLPRSRLDSRRPDGERAPARQAGMSPRRTGDTPQPHAQSLRVVPRLFFASRYVVVNHSIQANACVLVRLGAHHIERLRHSFISANRTREVANMLSHRIIVNDVDHALTTRGGNQTPRYIARRPPGFAGGIAWNIDQPIAASGSAAASFSGVSRSGVSASGKSGS